jgi:hypothetical protein
MFLNSDRLNNRTILRDSAIAFLMIDSPLKLTERSNPEVGADRRAAIRLQEFVQRRFGFSPICVRIYGGGWQPARSIGPFNARVLNNKMKGIIASSLPIGQFRYPFTDLGQRTPKPVKRAFPSNPPCRRVQVAGGNIVLSQEGFQFTQYPIWLMKNRKQASLSMIRERLQLVL